MTLPKKRPCRIYKKWKVGFSVLVDPTWTIALLVSTTSVELSRRVDVFCRHLTQFIKGKIKNIVYEHKTSIWLALNSSGSRISRRGRRPRRGAPTPEAAMF